MDNVSRETELEHFIRITTPVVSLRGLSGLFRFIGEMPLLNADWSRDVEREEFGDE